MIVNPFFLATGLFILASGASATTCGVIGEGINDNPSHCLAFDQEPSQKPDFQCCFALLTSLAINDPFLPTALRNVVDVSPEEIRITHDASRSVLYPLDTVKPNEFTFKVSSISSECYTAETFKFELSYTRLRSSEPGTCNLCNTTVQFNKAGASFPIEVTVKAKDEAEAEVHVQNIIFSACSVNLRKWPALDSPDFVGDHFYLPLRILALKQPNCKITLTFENSYRLLISKPEDQHHSNLGPFNTGFVHQTLSPTQTAGTTTASYETRLASYNAKVNKCYQEHGVTGTGPGEKASDYGWYIACQNLERDNRKCCEGKNVGKGKGRFFDMDCAEMCTSKHGDFYYTNSNIAATRDCKKKSASKFLECRIEASDAIDREASSGKN